MSALGRRIMLVDGDSDLCYLLSMILKLNEFDVSPFTDVDSALASYQKGHYDLFLLDVGTMPEMSGFELYKKIRKVDSGAKVCFMTNHRQECLQAFKESFPELASDRSLVEKPASSSALMEIITAACTKS